MTMGTGQSEKLEMSREPLKAGRSDTTGLTVEEERAWGGGGLSRLGLKETKSLATRYFHQGA